MHHWGRWYTAAMPTARHRYQITETDEVARALDAAERRWPGVPRSRLIVSLITENGSAISQLNETEAARRRAAIDTVAGSFAGLYPAGYLDDLRGEWPA
jgi:hypothetical protein